MTKSVGFDLLSIKPSGYEYELTHPGNGTGLGLFFQLRSIEDPEVKKVTRTITDRRLKLQRSGKNFKASEIEENEIEIIAAAVTGWRWGENADGEPANIGGEQLDFTPVNLRKILALDWARDQLNTELSDTSNFFQK